MARTIGQPKPRTVRIDDVTLQVAVPWDRWTRFQNDVREAQAQGGLEGEIANETAVVSFVQDCILSWEGVQDANGSPVQYTPDLLKQVFDPVEIVRLQNLIVSPADLDPKR